MSVHFVVVPFALFLLVLGIFYSRKTASYHTLSQQARSNTADIGGLREGDTAVVEATVSSQNETFSTPLSDTEAVSYIVGEQNKRRVVRDSKRYNTNDHLHHVYSPFTVEHQSNEVVVDLRQVGMQDEDPLRLTWARRTPKVLSVEPTIYDEATTHDDLLPETEALVDQIDDFNGPYSRGRYKRQYTERTIKPEETIAVVGRIGETRDGRPVFERDGNLLVSDSREELLDELKRRRRRSLIGATVSLLVTALLAWAFAPTFF